jgi:plastocyanin
MSKILVDELVNLAGTDKVTFSQGVRISSAETLDLNGATITLSDGVGLDNQLLASSGSGLKWVTLTDTNSIYAFASVNAASNDVKLRLTGSGDATGQQDQVTFTGAGNVVLTENAGVITITGTDINTTYDITVADITDGGSFALLGSDGAIDTISLLGGSNIDVVRSGNTYTFSTTLSGTVGAPGTTTDNAVALFDGVNGTLLKNSSLVFASNGDLSGVNDIAVNSISAATQTGNKIPFWYDQQSSFPSATTYEGSFAFSDANNTMHYAAGNSWYQVAKLGDIQQNTDTTYSINLSGTTSGTLTLSDSNAITDVVSFLGRNGVYTFRDNQQLYFDGKLYSISTELDSAQVVLRLHGENRNSTDQAVNTTNDDIVFTGADGLTVERTDANTITFRQGAGSGGSSYTDNAAKDAAAQALINGTSLGISFTYDQTARVINAQVGTSPTAFNISLAAETGNYLFTGTDRGNTYSGDADPSITVYEGDTLNFTNTVNASHPLYIRVSAGGSSVSSPAASGEGTTNVSWTPTTAGTYYYQCGVHPAMLGTITVLSSGGGGGGSSVLYDLYGTNTTSNNVFLNLDPSLGTTDQIEFAGAGGTTVSWDSVNKRATLDSTAPVQSDWNATSGLALILNKPSIPAAYTLPAASASSLGGVIPDGTTITVDVNGNIAAVPGAYTLPTAASNILGGIKIGSGLSIDAGGVVTVAAGGSVGLQARQDFSGTTSSLADNTTENLNITAYKAYTLLKVETDADAWVRIYTDAAARTADSTRSEGADPSPGSGVIAEISGSGVVRMSPAAIGYNNDSPSATDTVYTAVTNRSGSATTITVTLTAIRLEA